MGEVLHEVDFSQLKIENQQYIEKIDERNQDLLRLKLMAGNTLQILNAYKVLVHSGNRNCQCSNHFVIIIIMIWLKYNKISLFFHKGRIPSDVVVLGL